MRFAIDPLLRASPRLGTIVGLWVLAATAAAAEPRHGLSTFGDLKYPKDFPHFDYVNPDAPKGGRLATMGVAAISTFDTFNGYILKGDAAQGLGFIFDSLMTAAGDEPNTFYGLVANDAEVAPDKRSVTFRLRPGARFADGSVLTADDVAFSFEVLKEKGHPTIRLSLKDVAAAEVIDSHTVRYGFKGDLVRDLPLVVAALPIFSRAYYAAREFDATTLEPPLGSGPYRIGDFRQGTFVSYVRRPDYWAKDLNVNRGRFNFDEIRYEYYRDRTAALESLKAGAFDLREEFTSRDWATAYNIPAVKEGRLVLLDLPDDRPAGTQGFFLNTRKSKFQDVRVRKAFDYAFDFEFTNRNLFYGLYKRTTSYFQNSDMQAAGKPTAEELALLEPFRAKLSPEVFEEAYTPPVSDGSGNDRRLLQQANRLLTEAGWVLKGGRRFNTKGEEFEVEFLIDDPTSERILGPYVKNLQAIGVTTTVRRVDHAQFERRTKSYEYDIRTARFAMSLTPGVELRNLFGSEAANAPGSFNLAGIRDPVVDGLIERAMAAQSRAELVTAVRAMDRVLRAGHYWVSQWYKAVHNIVYWNKFSRPKVQPKYERGIEDTWWYDAEKAAKLKQQ
jgi:microcin C transport system substrate-binding protein